MRGWLERQPLAERTRATYAFQVTAFVTWLGERSGVDGDPLREPDARDSAARDYKRHAKQVRRWAPSSVNLALAAVDSF
jgi:integrase/recombinase XerC